MGVTSLVMMRALSPFRIATGVIMQGGFEAFLEATFTQVCVSKAGDGGEGQGSPGERTGGAGGYWGVEYCKMSLSI